MLRNASRLSPVLLLAALLFWGCVLPQQMYEGERLKRKHVAILDAECDCGARIIAVDSVRATNIEDGERPFYKGELALLPGKHTVEVYYQLTRYTAGSHSNEIIQRANRKTLPDQTTFISTNYKTITFEAKAGHKYRLDAESQPLDFPYGAMTWTAWVVDQKSGTQIAVATDE